VAIDASVLKITLFFIAASMWLPFWCYGGRVHKESWYQDRWCTARDGKIEVVLPDMTRCDCLTETHAIEFDFAPKWAEAVGQSLHYARLTGKRAGIVLIMESQGDRRYYNRLEAEVEAYSLPIDIWLTDAKGEPCDTLR